MLIPDRLIQIAVSFVMAAALTGQLPKFTAQLRVAQLKLLQESRSSNWGTPMTFKNIRQIEKASRDVTHIDWKPISIFPEEAKRFR